MPYKVRDDCVFCRIVQQLEPATILAEWRDSIAIRPLNPVVPGHVIVLPCCHVSNAVEDPAITGLTMQRASQLATASEWFGDPFAEVACNLITSVGRAATQTIEHLHIHVVPRRRGDGLALPWGDPADG